MPPAPPRSAGTLVAERPLSIRLSRSTAGARMTYVGQLQPNTSAAVAAVQDRSLRDDEGPLAGADGHALRRAAPRAGHQVSARLALNQRPAGAPIVSRTISPIRIPPSDAARRQKRGRPPGTPLAMPGAKQFPCGQDLRRNRKIVDVCNNAVSQSLRSSRREAQRRGAAQRRDLHPTSLHPR
jgi:hypothetical protein